MQLNRMTLLDDIVDQRWIFTLRKKPGGIFLLNRRKHTFSHIDGKKVLLTVDASILPFCKANDATYTGKHNHFSTLIFLGVT